MMFGPTVEADAVLFRLWAPDAAAVEVEIDGRGIFPLVPQQDGWKEVRIACSPGTRYRFRLGETVFPDPASRAQQGGAYGWSVVEVPQAADGSWRGRRWEETVLYECHPGLMGGFAGITAKLESLASLGITAIELMPIAAFPGARNWGYDGVLPFAPAESYGTPAELRALIARAHALNLMIFLDVVYNHFGPDGNYLPLYAKSFFRSDIPTPWGSAIDFRIPQVQRFFFENACTWLFEFGFDGLRFDAVHAITDDGWLDRLATELRQKAGTRHIHLVLENEDNIASHLRPAGRKFDAQWNDDIHHALHVLLTGDSGGYYQDFAKAPAAHLARALKDGFIYQGNKSDNRHGRPRGEFSADLPPSAFVAFLQNHDQIGNRAFGERLTALARPEALKAATALLLLMPQIPLLFMGEEIGSQAPFLYFTDHGSELAKAVREGRRKEFAAFAAAAGGREIPDPNALQSFDASRPETNAPHSAETHAFYQKLLTLRREWIIPHLKGAEADGADAIGEKAVVARWRLGDGSVLTLATNLGEDRIGVTLPTEVPLWGDASSHTLPPMTTLAWVVS
jgi:maltooligosyltrehalose trehalohydrolase